MEHKFKIGSTVTPSKWANSMSAVPGDLATVIGYEGDFIVVKWLRNKNLNKNSGLRYKCRTTQMDGHYFQTSLTLPNHSLSIKQKLKWFNKHART